MMSRWIDVDERLPRTPVRNPNFICDYSESKLLLLNVVNSGISRARKRINTGIYV